MFVKPEDYAANPALFAYFSQIAAIELPEPVRHLRDIRLAAARLELVRFEKAYADYFSITKSAVLTVLAVAENELRALIERQHSHWVHATQNPDQPGLGCFVFKTPHPFRGFVWTAENSDLFSTALEIELDRDSHEVVYEIWWPQSISAEHEVEIIKAGGASNQELHDSAKEKLLPALLALAKTPSFRALCRQLGLEIVNTILGSEKTESKSGEEPNLDNSPF